jgi:iron complex transport system ATP-binding protein
MKEFLKVNSISYGYGNTFILEEISFSVAQGEFLGIIGPNGAGKTTLLKTINRILVPQKGEIFLEKLNLQHLSLKHIAQKISIVGQDIQLSFSLSVLDLVLMGRFPHVERFKKETKQDLEIVHQCLELTQTEDLANRQFSQLSAGERQRVILAKALAQQPQLLLLDEPTAHLDIGHQIKMFDLLVKLNQQKQLTIIIVLHDLNLAAEYCETLILLEQGKIISYGNCWDVLQFANIERAYGTVVLVKENPISHKPYILPVPGKYVHLN